MTARLPARIEAMGLIRAVQAAGGFGTVLHRGEVDAGALMIVLVEARLPARAFERMPGIDGERTWHCARTEDSDDPQAFAQYLDRRASQDDDLWIIELDIAEGERFIR
jgi:hypothetical protein